ncbi:hypothetical protein BDZ45DRAFT_100052 [Acephala macrosclerotiorum]|nr:hypothetical protein BDZ45DRAFT_100052 [Acephala macrosclerotiorum]
MPVIWKHPPSLGSGHRWRLQTQTPHPRRLTTEGTSHMRNASHFDIHEAQLGSGTEAGTTVGYCTTSTVAAGTAVETAITLDAMSHQTSFSLVMTTTPILPRALDDSLHCMLLLYFGKRTQYGVKVLHPYGIFKVPYLHGVVNSVPTILHPLVVARVSMGLEPIANDSFLLRRAQEGNYTVAAVHCSARPGGCPYQYFHRDAEASASLSFFPSVFRHLDVLVLHTCKQRAFRLSTHDCRSRSLYIIQDNYLHQCQRRIPLWIIYSHINPSSRRNEAVKAGQVGKAGHLHLKVQAQETTEQSESQMLLNIKHAEVNLGQK